MQHGVIRGAEPTGVPLTNKMMPQFLRDDLGYATHAVGKWHLGSHRHPFLPTSRGVDSHFGYWTGKEDYYGHTNLDPQVAYLVERFTVFS